MLKSKCKNPSKLGTSSSPSRANESRSTKPLTPNLRGTRSSYQNVGGYATSRRSIKNSEVLMGFNCMRPAT